MGSILVFVLVVGSLVMPTSVVSVPQAPAWCFDRDNWRWLGYAEGVPGSASQAEFGNCLTTAAERGEVIEVSGSLTPEGVILESEGQAVRWDYGIKDGTYMSVSVFDDLIEFEDACDRRIELHGGQLSIRSHGYGCQGPIRINRDPAHVSKPDFSIYVVGTGFVAIGDDGWYHIDDPATAWYAKGRSGSRVYLYNRIPGVWISAEWIRPGPEGGTNWEIRSPLAGSGPDTQQHLVADWEYRVRAQLIPRSFSTAGSDFFPNALAVWELRKDAVDAIMEDLFHGRDKRPQLALEAQQLGLTYANTGSYFAVLATFDVVLHLLAQEIIDQSADFDVDMAGTLLMLWDRYVPGFDRVEALRLADRYGVVVGSSVEVNPVSELTENVGAILGRTPPAAPSDQEPIAPEDLHLSIVLELGTSYDHPNNVPVVSTELSPGCVREEVYGRDLRRQYVYAPVGRFTVNAGGTWNGIRLLSGTGGTFIRGTPTQAGRVRVEVTNKCHGGFSEERKLVGYSEIIVVDPNAE